MNLSNADMNLLHLAQVDLNLLVSFETLLRERSVTLAARQLGLSQSAMSHQLKRLRDMFDDPLLVAGKGGMIGTPRAEALQAPVRRALADLSRALRGEVRFDPRTTRRTFVIAVKDTIEVLGLPPLLELFSREAPGVQLESSAITALAPAALQEGSLDLVLGPHLDERFGIRFPGLASKVLVEGDLAIVVRRDHPVARGRSEITTEDLSALRHVVVASETWDKNIEAAYREQGIDRLIAAKISQFVGAFMIVAQTDFVLIAPRGMALHFVEVFGLCVLDVPFPMHGSRLVMTWHERFTEDPANRWLREVVERLCCEVDAKRASAGDACRCADAGE